jgi:hypothetical protein
MTAAGVAWLPLGGGLMQPPISHSYCRLILPPGKLGCTGRQYLHHGEQDKFDGEDA